MIKIQVFAVNAFQENSYLLFDDSNEAILIDPGFYEEFEYEELYAFLELHSLKLIKIVRQV